MALPLSFDSQQFLPWNEADGSLRVTSVRPNSSDEWDEVSPFAAYPGQVREARPSNGVFQIEECVFTFGLDAVQFAPKPRDTVLWDRVSTAYAWAQDTFTVKSVQRADLLRFWRLDCFRLVAHADLCDTIAVYRPTVTAGSDGLRSRTVAAVSGYGTVAGRLQPEGWEQESDTDGRVLRRQRFTAYLSEAVALLHGDILRVNSVDYEVIGQGMIDQYDQFTTATCTRVA